MSRRRHRPARAAAKRSRQQEYVQRGEALDARQPERRGDSSAAPAIAAPPMSGDPAALAFEYVHGPAAVRIDRRDVFVALRSGQRPRVIVKVASCATAFGRRHR